MEKKELELHNKINLRGMLSSFLDILVEKFQESMDTVGILGSDIAYNSFQKALFYSGGDVSKASVTFVKYLRMVDMGVGKGMPIGSRRQLGDSKFLSKRERNGRLKSMKRKAKKWYGKTRTSQAMRLRELLARDYSLGVMQEMESALTQQLKLNI